MKSGSDRVDKSISPLHPNISMYIIQTDLYIIPKVLADKENLFNNQEFLLLVIISFILMILKCESGVILLGEIRCWSLSGVKGLRCLFSTLDQPKKNC